MMLQRVLAGLAALAMATPVLHYWRGWAWSLAWIIGLAFGAFAFLLVRAIHNLLAWRPR
jgi:uncharacterized membrane protein